jgi:hypothetical protein
MGVVVYQERKEAPDTVGHEEDNKGAVYLRSFLPEDSDC